MADDLKRVGLIFKADGSVDFVKSLQTVNAELRENYQQFQLIQTQWDKNSKTSEKLQARLNYLNDAYEIQSKKVEQLRINLGELENAEIKDEKAIQQKKAALAQAETELAKYGKQIDSVSKKIQSGTADLEDFAKKLDKTGESMVSAGKKASVFSAAYAAATGLAIKGAIDFESAIAGVNKTVDGTPEQLKAVETGIRDMAKEIPASTTEIASVAEAAGQLGIETDNVLAFTRVMIDLGESTTMSAEAIATTAARFANVTKMSQKDFDKLGSTIVALGNNFATTESEISAMAMNLGSAGTQVGMSQSDILALATALSSVGLEAQAGGTAFSKVMIEMQLAAETGSDKLKDFAAVAGMSADEFAQKFKIDATGALMDFIDGLSETGNQGISAIKILDDMGITETRLRDALLRSANASDIFSEAIGLGSEAWEENTALTEEAQKRYETTGSQIDTMKNNINDLVISFGELLLPVVRDVVGKITELVNWLNSADDTTKRNILVIGGLTATIGPLLIVFGSLARNLSSVILLLTSENSLMAFNVIKKTAVATATWLYNTAQSALNLTIGIGTGLLQGLSAAMSFLAANPIVLVILAIGALVAGFIYLRNTSEEFRDFFIKMWEAIQDLLQKFDDWIQGVFSTDWTDTFGILGNVLNSFLANIGNFYESAKRIFGGILDFVAGLFTGNWKKAWQGISDIFGGIFDGLRSIAIAPLNAIIGFLNVVIDALNGLIRGLNKIKFTTPDWIPMIGGKSFGINISTIGKLSYLATGGDLLSGASIVGEAGPELILQGQGRSTVVPLTESGGSNQTDLIDYDRLGNSVANAMKKMKFALDDDGFGKFVDDKLLEVLT